MHKLERFAPPGMELDGWRNFSVTVFLGCAAFSFIAFFYSLLEAYRMLFDPLTGELKDIVHWNFVSVLGISMKGFPIFAASMVAFVVLNYLYFFEGSKSIYTMARVKSPWQLHIRCWTLPLCSAAALLLCQVVLTVLYFLIFILATPKGVPLPGWRHLIGGLLT